MFGYRDPYRNPFGYYNQPSNGYGNDVYDSLFGIPVSHLPPRKKPAQDEYHRPRASRQIPIREDDEDEEENEREERDEPETLEEQLHRLKEERYQQERLRQERAREERMKQEKHRQELLQKRKEERERMILEHERLQQERDRVRLEKLAEEKERFLREKALREEQERIRKEQEELELQQLQEEKAAEIQRVFRGYLVRRHNPLQRMKKLSEIEQVFNDTVEKFKVVHIFEHDEELRAKKDTIDFEKLGMQANQYEEELTRILLSLDEVDSGGWDNVRAKRKELVAKVQNVLSQLGHLKKKIDFRVKKAVEEKKKKRELEEEERKRKEIEEEERKKKEMEAERKRKEKEERRAKAAALAESTTPEINPNCPCCKKMSKQIEHLKEQLQKQRQAVLSFVGEEKEVE